MWVATVTFYNRIFPEGRACRLILWMAQTATPACLTCKWTAKKVKGASAAVRISSVKLIAQEGSLWPPHGIVRWGRISGLIRLRLTGLHVNAWRHLRWACHEGQEAKVLTSECVGTPATPSPSHPHVSRLLWASVQISSPVIRGPSVSLVLFLSLKRVHKYWQLHCF